jgi:dihydrofolate synthase / folylpolyglutamate synthase
VPATPDQILAGLEGLGMRLGLDSLRRLLRRLGNPHLRFPVVLVAGTNGKGSTSALLAAMAGAAGYRTGLYTSPHLESVTERIRLNGRAIDSERLAGRLDEVLAAARVEDELPTYFEAMTAAAFLDLAEEGVELGIFEVGLGGRLDATNAADPILAVITPVDVDHAEQLGPTPALIAREKAGILRAGRPAVVWLEEPTAAEAVRRAAAELGAELHEASQEVRIQAAVPLGSGQRVRLATPRGAYDLTLALAGAHQAANLGLAVRAAEVLAGAGYGLLDGQSIARGTAQCRWPGRLELVQLPQGYRGQGVLLDAAHNPAGAAALAAFLDDTSGRIDLVFGALADKDAGPMLDRLAPRLRHLILTTPASPRARPPAELAELLPGRAGLILEPDPGRALERGLELRGDLLVVCGSIYLIGDIRQRLTARFGVPEPAAEI